MVYHKKGGAAEFERQTPQRQNSHFCRQRSPVPTPLACTDPASLILHGGKVPAGRGLVWLNDLAAEDGRSEQFKKIRQTARKFNDETGGIGTVDGAVVVRQGEWQHQAFYDLTFFHDQLVLAA